MEDSEEEVDDELRKDNVVRLHKMGRERDNLIRSDKEGDNLLRSEEIRDNLIRSGEDVMSRLFDWDFDQLLRQENNQQYILIKISPGRELGMSAGIVHSISWLTI